MYSLQGYKKELIFLAIALLVIIAGCRYREEHINATPPNHLEVKPVQKPPSSFNDTVEIEGVAAIFFEPDNKQLGKLKAIMNEKVFKSMQHDYLFQVNNSVKYLNRDWPQVKQLKIKDARYLACRLKDGSHAFIDLNNYEANGLFVFDGKKNPVPVDMTNVETGVTAYFNDMH